jgi:hypothetical protein
MTKNGATKPWPKMSTAELADAIRAFDDPKEGLKSISPFAFTPGHLSGLVD